MRRLIIAILNIVVAATSVVDCYALSFHVEQIGSVPETDTIGGSGFSETMLGDKLLFTSGLRGSREFYTYDGSSFQKVSNPIGIEPSGANFGGVLGATYFFTAQGVDGTALYKTDGNTIALVADFDPSLSDGQTIQNLTFTDTHLYMRAVGPNGRELYRTDGTTNVEFDIVPGADSSNPFALIRFGEDVIFRALNPATGSSATYRANANGVQLLTNDVSFGFNVGCEHDNKLFAANGDDLYQYDGVSISQVNAFNGIDSLFIAPFHCRFNPEDLGFLAVTGTGLNGVATYTWDGSTLTEYDTDPYDTGGHPFFATFIDGAFFATQGGPNGRELFRVTETGFVEYDILPGATSSTPDIRAAVEFNGSLVFRADGPLGNELYVADATGFTLLEDINPGVGDTFPLSVDPPVRYKDNLYFRAFAPATGDEIYRTDGNTVELFVDLLPGPDSSDGNFGNNGFVQPVSPDLELYFLNIFQELYVSDGDTVVSLDEVVRDSASGFGQRAWLARYDEAILYFTTSGDVFRITIVPEPASKLLLVLVVGAIFSCRYTFVR